MERYYAYDYAFLILSHAAATLLRLSNDGSRDNALRYCGMAITALVANECANNFARDIAGILSLIAKGSGMMLSDWVDEKVIAALEGTDE